MTWFKIPGFAEILKSHLIHRYTTGKRRYLKQKFNTQLAYMKMAWETGENKINISGGCPDRGFLTKRDPFEGKKKNKWPKSIA